MSQSEPTSTGVRLGRGSWSRIARLIRKELSEILRDRRTIVTLVLMPLLLYPLLSIAFRQLLLSTGAATTEQITLLRIGFIRQADASEFLATMSLAQRTGDRFLLDSKPDDAAVRFQLDPRGFLEVDEAEIPQRLRDKHIDLAVFLEQKIPRRNRSLVLQWRIVHYSGSIRSLQARRFIERKLAALNAAFLERGLDALDRSILSRIREEVIEAAPGEFPFAAVIPLILILMTMTGAVYPAIDLTAGERERGTLEMLVAAPVPRLGLLFAKYVSVWTVAVLTAAINIAMMLLMIWINGLGPLLFGSEGLHAGQIAAMFALLLLFAGFFSAVLLVLTSFARSFKEAQAYLIPLMLVSLAPGLAGMLPDLKLSPGLCMVPLLNMVLLGRDLFSGTGGPELPVYFGAIVAITGLYAVAALAAAARIFGSESVLYSDQPGWRELWRRPSSRGSAATLANALLTTAVVFFLSFMAQGIIGQILASANADSDELVSAMLVLGILGVIWFGGLPLLVSRWRNIDIHEGFLLYPPRGTALAGVIFVGSSSWLIALQLQQWMVDAGWTSLGAETGGQYALLARQLQTVWASWLGVVVAQAVAEEWFFRGYLFRALERSLGSIWAVLASAALFSGFHVVTLAGLRFEQCVPSLFMGLLLGLLVWRTRSILAVMATHSLHNAALVLASRFRLGQAEGSVDWRWTASATAVLAVGLALAAIGRARGGRDGPSE